MYRLEHQLLELHTEQGGGVVLFTWLSFVQEELLAFLGMETEINTTDLVDAQEVDNGETESLLMEELKIDQSVQPEDSQGATSTSFQQLPEVRCNSTSLSLGTVKKWKQEGSNSGHGYIRGEGNREWSFSLKDCLILAHQHQQPSLFSKGDRVCFQQVRNSARKSARAVNVRLSDANELIKNDHDKQVETEDDAMSSRNLPDCDEIVNNVDPVRKLIGRETNNAGIAGKKTSKQKKIITLLREFNQMKKDEKFSLSLHSCDICFTDKVCSDPDISC